MAAKRKDTLRRQIGEQIGASAAPIEERLAESLIKTGEFRGDLDASDLTVVLTKVLYTLVGQQRIAGMSVPITHNVSAMKVRIIQREIVVFCEVHVHRPLVGFIRFHYTLVNGRDHNLRLKNDRVKVDEITRPFDLAAKAALRVMGVPRIAYHELRDPAGVIQRTLPDQLKPYGFEEAIAHIELAITPDDMLRVYLSVDKQDG